MNSGVRQLPDWVAPPLRSIPWIVGINEVFIHTDELSIWLSDVAAFSVGWSFGLNVYRRSDETEMPDLPLHLNSEPPDLRFEIQADDGPIARTGDFPVLGVETRPDSPVLALSSGPGASGHRRLNLWYWPIPQAEMLTLTCSWPKHSIDPIERQIHAAELIAASGRSLPPADPGDF